MQIDYVGGVQDIHVRKVGSSFEAINHAFFLETQLRLKGESEVVFEGKKIKVIHNDNQEIVEKKS